MDEAAIASILDCHSMGESMSMEILFQIKIDSWLSYSSGKILVVSERLE